MVRQQLVLALGFALVILSGCEVADSPLPAVGTLERDRIALVFPFTHVGGMGCVYLVEHEKLGRLVALKVLRPEHAANPKTLRRFFAEARAANRIAHRNIIQVTEFYEDLFHALIRGSRPPQYDEFCCRRSS